MLQGVYEPHQDIHMQPFPEGATGQTYSSSLPAQQTASTDRMHPGFPAAGELQYACQHLLCIVLPTEKSDAGPVRCFQQHMYGTHGAKHTTVTYMHADLVAVVLSRSRCAHCTSTALILAGLGPG